ncbi:MAG: hypothetical protein RLY50_684, partial [Actinomycetota bacterium]
VPFAVDAADREGVDAVAVVLRERDVVPSIEKLAARARRSVSLVAI